MRQQVVAEIAAIEPFELASKIESAIATAVNTSRAS